jgi:hypothetical protein
MERPEAQARFQRVAWVQEDLEGRTRGIAQGRAEAEVAAVMGGNWLRFFETGFGPPDAPQSRPTEGVGR